MEICSSSKLLTLFSWYTIMQYFHSKTLIFNLDRFLIFPPGSKAPSGLVKLNAVLFDV